MPLKTDPAIEKAVASAAINHRKDGATKILHQIEEQFGAKAIGLRTVGDIIQRARHDPRAAAAIP